MGQGELIARGVEHVYSCEDCGVVDGEWVECAELAELEAAISRAGEQEG